MSRKFGIGLVVMIAALGLVASLAQAEPHYYKNGVLMGSEPLPVVEWGTLTFKSTSGGVGIISCRTVIAGSVENPEGGGAGTGETESLNSYGCELNECPMELELDASVYAESLPWPSVLILEGTTVRQKTSGIKFDVECYFGEKVVGGQRTVGSLRPKMTRGTSALHPGVVEYDAGSGELEAEGSENKIKGKTEGKLKVLGYEEQEVVNAKTS